MNLYKNSNKKVLLSQNKKGGNKKFNFHIFCFKTYPNKDFLSYLNGNKFLAGIKCIFLVISLYIFLWIFAVFWLFILNSTQHEILYKKGIALKYFFNI